MSDAAAPWIAVQRDALLRQRGHAWLLQGPSGLGQYPLALELVRGWLCERPGGQGACGHCASCHAIDVRAHADLFVLMPEALMLELEWPLAEKVQRELDKKERKPSREIRVDALRDAIEFTQRTSARGRGKAVLVYPAERMNAVAANTLLKTLEEPPGEVRFVLASESAQRLPATIRSRCQIHTMAWPAPADALAWLSQQEGVGKSAEVLLRAAGGRPDAALDMARRGVTGASWAALPKAVQRGETEALRDASPAQAIDALQKLCHDLQVARQGAQPRFFCADDLPAPPAADVLAPWSRELSQAARTAEHPFKADLMLDSLVARARQVLHSGAPKTPPRR